MSPTTLESPRHPEQTASPTDRGAEKSRSKNQIGRYHLVQKLGSGETGNVYRARQWGIDRNVIIKVLPRRLQKDSEYLDRFYQAAKTAGRLQHINIVKAIDVGQSPGGHHYFVMEDIEGRSLKELLDSGESFDEPRAIEIIAPIVRALAHAHCRNIFHGEIHPENIHLTDAQVVKLAGLGLAKELVDHSAHRTRVVKWATHYASPEEVRGAPKDIRSDIFALGATLYHLLTGIAPFKGQSPVEILAARLTKTLKSPRSLDPKISRALCQVLERMLAREPEDRYQTPQELLEDLERLPGGHAQLSERLAPKKTCVRRPVREKRKTKPAATAPEPSRAAAPAKRSVPPRVRKERVASRPRSRSRAPSTPTSSLKAAFDPGHYFTLGIVTGIGIVTTLWGIYYCIIP